MAAELVVIGWGNVARGDDALGPLLIERLSRFDRACGCRLRLVCDYQLQIEHLAELEAAARVLFVDADAALDRPCRFEAVAECLQTRYTTHGISPASLLAQYRQVYRSAPPPATLLRLGGRRFELGEGLSETARDSLEQGDALLESIFSARDFSVWDRLLQPALLEK